jgi:hypothetical protein
MYISTDYCVDLKLFVYIHITSASTSTGGVSQPLCIQMCAVSAPQAISTIALFIISIQWRKVISVPSAKCPSKVGVGVVTA